MPVTCARGYFLVVLLSMISCTEPENLLGNIDRPNSSAASQVDDPWRFLVVDWSDEVLLETYHHKELMKYIQPVELRLYTPLILVASLTEKQERLTSSMGNIYFPFLYVP